MTWNHALIEIDTPLTMAQNLVKRPVKIGRLKYDVPLLLEIRRDAKKLQQSMETMRDHVLEMKRIESR